MNKQDERVLQISHDYHGPFVAVCRQYAAAFSDGTVTTVFLRGEESEQVRAQIPGEVIFLGKTEGSLRGIKFDAIFRLAKLCRKRRYSLVVGHRYKGIYLAGILSYFFPFRVVLGVVHEHGVFKRITRHLFVTFWRPKLKLIAVSDSVKQDIHSEIPSLTADRLIRLHHVAAGEVPLDKASARAQLQIEHSGLVSGVVARLVAKKSVDIVVKAYAEYKQRQPHSDSLLVIVGDGKEKQKLLDQAKRLGNGESILFTGWQDQAGRCIAAFDVLIFSSGNQEAFGMVLLEAMSAGVPIICSDAPGPLEVVGDCALVYSREDATGLAVALERFVALSVADRDQMVQRGRKRVSTLFSQSTFNNTLAQYLIEAGGQVSHGR